MNETSNTPPEIAPEVLLERLNGKGSFFMSQLPSVINADSIKPLTQDLINNPTHEAADALDNFIEGVINPSLKNSILILSRIALSKEECCGVHEQEQLDIDLREAVSDLRNFIMEYCSMYYEISLAALKAITRLVPEKTGGAK